jgi:hypothetical protein
MRPAKIHINLGARRRNNIHQVRILTSSTYIYMGLLTTATSVHAWGKTTVPLLHYTENINVFCHCYNMRREMTI